MHIKKHTYQHTIHPPPGNDGVKPTDDNVEFYKKTGVNKLGTTSIRKR